MSLKCVNFVFTFTVGFFFVFNQAIGAPPASPCDGLQLNLDQVAIINLNLDPAPALGTTVSRTATSGKCDYFIVIDNGASSTFSQRKLSHGSDPATVPIQIYKEAAHSNIIKSVAEATTTNDIIFNTLNGSTTQQFPKFYAVIDPNISVPSTVYTDSFSISLYTWNGSNLGTKALVQTRSSNFKFTKDSTLELSLVDTGAPFNSLDVNQSLNFGTLTTGESMAFDVMLKYSSGYILSMSSANSNRLKESSSANYVDYSITLEGAALPLTLSNVMQQVKSGTGTSPSLGTRLPMIVTIGDTTGKTSGTYTDTVSISVSSL